MSRAVTRHLDLVEELDELEVKTVGIAPGGREDQAEREIVALDRDDRAKLLWRADERLVVLVTGTRAYFDRQRSVDLFTGR